MSRFKDLFEWILPPLLSQGRPSPTNVGKPAAGSGLGHRNGYR